MQELKEVRRPAGLRWPQSLFVSRNTLIVFLVIIVGPTLFYSDLIITRWHGLPGTPAACTSVGFNGANHWVGDRKVTAPAFDFSAPASQEVNTSPLFERYYHSHSGVTSLGAPVTPAIPTEQGWIQFFASGALLLPTAQQKHRLNAEDPLVELIDTGVRDQSSGIIRLPLLQALLTAGSQVPVGGDRSPLTYVDLRKAANPDLMLPIPAASGTATPTHAGSQKVFIKGGTRDGQDVGHLVPLPLWSYINRADVSPDGWEKDFGAPLTESIPFTVTNHGKTHQLLVQVFWRDGLILDETTPDVSDQPQIQRLDTGVAYLRTVGPPTFEISPAQTIWSQGETALLDAPGTGHAVAHVGQDFPLTLLGDANWKMGMPWYHVQWTVPKRTATGWVSAAAITFTSPGSVPGWASFDVLSPDLAAYLDSIGDNVNTVVYDVTRQRYYSYHADAQFITGSAIKAPIMLTFLDMVEQQHRKPNAYEMALLTTMIENSNNDSAAILYQNEIGGAAGVTRFLQRIGIAGLDPDPGVNFGWSVTTPLAMVKLLTHLYDGSILTASDRQLALYLMEHIQSDQQAGVGDTAPAGATVAMKDGWVVGPDGLWGMNSSGIVTVGQETYIISVYTQDQYSLENGQAIVRYVCGSVASLLT
ncbi:MAG: serine hydrolase [Ktedonobacteraceae bacterium]